MKMLLSKAIKIVFAIAIVGLLVSYARRSFMEDEKTVPLLGKQGLFGEEKTAQDLKVHPIRTSGIAGSLSIYMMRDPSFPAFSMGVSGEDQSLDLWLTGEEWGALFLNVLRCPHVDDVARLPGEGEEQWQGRYAEKFAEAIPSLPLLSRIWDVWIYVSFRPEEVDPLRAECLTIQANTSNKKAGSALTKLLKACDEALRHGSGLLFVPD